MTIDEILKEKEIPKKVFYEIYRKASEDNPILYQYIFESLSKNKRRGYLKLIRLGYKVLNTSIISIDEYNEKFGNVISFSELVSSLENTSLYQELLDKANKWEDFDNSNVKRRVLKNKEA